MLIFSNIGAQAAAANLLRLFNIPLIIATSDINNKYGNVILVSNTAKSNCSGINVKPGAKIIITHGIKTSKIRVKPNKKKNITAKIFSANILAFFFPEDDNLAENIGTKAALNAPSPNNLLKKFGNLNATKNTSVSGPAPKNAAINISLRKPVMREIKVKLPIVKTDFPRDIKIKSCYTFCNLFI
jgi:hypothetical protein